MVEAFQAIGVAVLARCGIARRPTRSAKRLYEDRHGRFWVGTHQGLNVLELPGLFGSCR